MYTKVNGEQQVQILSPNFSISPSNEDYVLNISANGRDFSPLFAVSAGVTRLVSNVAPGSYYKLVGNRSEVVINWQRMCATEGGSFDPSVLDPYWTSAQTQSAITAVEDHLFDVEEVTASALTELHDDVLELSASTAGKADAASTTANTVNKMFPKWNEQGIITGSTAQAFGSFIKVNDDLAGVFFSNTTKYDSSVKALRLYSPLSAGTAGEVLVSTGNGAPVWSAVTMPDMAAYTPTSRFSTINGSAITNGGDIVIQGGADLSAYYTSAQTEDAISAATSGKADAANIVANPNGDIYFPRWNSQGIITGKKSTQEFYDVHFYLNGASRGKIITNNAVGFGSLYAPTTPGTAGQILVSAGNGAPVWTTDNKVSSTSVSTIWKGTTAEYNAIVNKDPKTLYIIVDNV